MVTPLFFNLLNRLWIKVMIPIPLPPPWKRWGATVNEIAQSAGQSNQITEEILDVNNNIGQSALATEEITKELAVTQEGARDVQADSLKLTKNAGVLSDLAQNFIEIICVFKV